MEKYVLVSGAYGGLGLSTVNSLLNNGYKVICVDKVINNPNNNTVNFEVDITNSNSINDVYDKLVSMNIKLYSIVNLVGIFKMDSLLEGSVDLMRTTIEVNFLGIYALTQKLIPLLEKGGKIINCTSELAGYSAIPFNSFYTLSKVIYDNYSDTLRRELNYLGYKVVKVHSGSFKTGLIGNASASYDELYEKTKFYKKQFDKLKHLMTNELEKTNDPKKFGKLILKIINKKNPKIKYNIKRSLKLRLMSSLPEKLQDKLYKIYVK